VGRVERMFVWSGVAGFVVLFLGMAVARVLPPPPPGDTAEQTAAVLAARATPMRIGFLLVMLGGTMMTPFLAQIVAQMRRMRGPGRAAADTQLIFGVLLVAAIVFPAMLMEVVLFRPEAAVESIQLLHDTFWLFFVGLVAPYVVEALLMAIAILSDRRQLFPRWTGYGLLATPLMSAFGGFCVFTKTGPLAWNGFLAFWVAVISFGWWAMLMTVGMLHAVDQPDDEEERDVRAAPEAAGAAPPAAALTPA